MAWTDDEAALAGFSGPRLRQAAEVLARHVATNEPPLPGAVLLAGRGERR
jgi:hypothetical protein